MTTPEKQTDVAAERPLYGKGDLVIGSYRGSRPIFAPSDPWLGDGANGGASGVWYLGVALASEYRLATAEDVASLGKSVKGEEHRLAEKKRHLARCRKWLDKRAQGGNQ